MDIRTLSYFVCVCRHKSISRASEELFISRQALSSALSKLEADLGVLLLIRRKSGLEITAAGQQLLESSEHILQHWNECLSKLSLLTSSKRHPIHVSLCSWLIALLTPDCFLSFERQNRDAEVVLSSKAPSKCLEALAEESCSFAVFCCKPNSSLYASTLLRTERLCALYRTGLRPALTASAELSTFRGLTMLTCSHSEILPKLLAFPGVASAFSLRATPDNIDYVRGLLAADDCFLVLPESLAVRLADSSFSFTYLADTAPLSTYLIEKRGVTHTPVEEAFRSHLLRAFAAL